MDRKTGIAEMIRSIARRKLGETSEKISTAGRRETWWWNQGVQEKLKDKKKAKKAWDTIRDDTRVSQKVMSPVNFNRFNLHIFSRNFKGV